MTTEKTPTIEGPQMVQGVCSRKPRPSVQTNRTMFKTCESAWGRDVWHVQKSGITTLCGIDCSDFIRIGETKIDHNLCQRCRARLADQKEG